MDSTQTSSDAALTRRDHTGREVNIHRICVESSLQDWLLNRILNAGKKRKRQTKDESLDVCKSFHMRAEQHFSYRELIFLESQLII